MNAALVRVFNRIPVSIVNIVWRDYAENPLRQDIR